MANSYENLYRKNEADIDNCISLNQQNKKNIPNYCQTQYIKINYEYFNIEHIKIKKIIEDKILESRNISDSLRPPKK